MSRRIKDPRLFQLLREIINSEDTRFGLPAGVSPDECPEEDWLGDVGMPIGNLTSQLFANIYLNELDQLCKHELHLHYYIRYMDDVIILLPDKKELARVKAIIEEFLNDYLHLNLNNKTAIRPCSLGIDFVGYHIWATHRKLKKQTARKIIHAVDWMCEQGEKGNMSKEEFERRVASYRGILLHCDSYGLRKKLNSIYSDHVVTEEPEKQEAKQKPECAERKCYTCQYFHREFFCGYGACKCDIYGSLDVDQKERPGLYTKRIEKEGIGVYIDGDTIIRAAAILGALIALGTAAYAVIKWFQKQEKQTVDIEELRKKEEQDLKELRDEQCLISYAMLACLDGLKQLNCNGAVTEAHNKLEKHLNQKAHRQ